VRVVVRATNTVPGPVWVTLGAPFPGGDGAPVFSGFGFTVTRAADGDPVAGAFRSVLRGRVPFGAGQTRQFVFDVNAASYAAGEYVVLGFYNGRRTSAPLRVDP
jgi:hypothetical protein